MVEVIVGRQVDTANGNLTHAKNPRRLHLPAIRAGAEIWVELTAVTRKTISNLELAGHLPKAMISITPALQYWLAARYRRSAFPDAFNKHLSDTRLADRIARILEPFGASIIAIFFDVDEGIEREHESDEDPFTLSIDLLYSTEIDPTTSEAAARQAAEAITHAFRDRCFDAKTNRWRAIELVDCAPISDEALTYSMSLRLRRWNADHISLRAEPPQPIVGD
jgi:hypothetical protein